jgi:hypothetical protein
MKKSKKKKPTKATITIKIKNQDDIIIERIVKDYEEQVEGNEEIAMIRNNSL